MDNPRPKKIFIKDASFSTLDQMAAVLLLLVSPRVQVQAFLMSESAANRSKLVSLLQAIGQENIPILKSSSLLKRKMDCPDAIFVFPGKSAPHLPSFLISPSRPFNFGALLRPDDSRVELAPELHLESRASGLYAQPLLRSHSPKATLLQKALQSAKEKPGEFRDLLLVWYLLFPENFLGERQQNYLELVSFSNEEMMQEYTIDAFLTEEEIAHEFGKKGIAGRYEVRYPLARPDPRLSLVESGWEHRRPSSLYGPAIRDFYIFHFISKGEGVYEINGQKIPLKAGDCFLVPPGLPVRYGSAPHKECAYFWAGFTGSESKDFCERSGYLLQGVYVRHFKEKSQLRRHFYVLAHLPAQEGAFYQGMSELYAIFALLIQSASGVIRKKNSYIERALQEIEQSGPQTLRVDSLSKKIGLERSYFYRLFKEKTGQSIKAYLLGRRLEIAKKQLLESNESIREIAQLAGWENYLSFLSYFQKRTGMTPKRFRETYQEKSIKNNKN